ISQTTSPAIAIAGAPLSYSIVVANGGPAAATNASLTWTLPSGATFVSAVSTQGSCSFSPVQVLCDFATLPAGTAAGVAISVNVGAGTSLDAAASVTSSVSDPVTVNNSSTLTTPIVPASSLADLSIDVTDSADPVSPGTPFTYTLRVRNSGPANAAAVTLSDVLPAGVTLNATATPQGSCTSAAGQVTCSLGTVASDATVDVTLNVTAVQPGLLSNTGFVASSTLDAAPENNVDSELTMVGTVAPCAAPTFSGPTITTSAEDTTPFLM